MSLAVEIPTSKEDWLEKRRHGVTATELARLGVARFSELSMLRLKHEKLNPPPSFENEYTRWGKQREVNMWGHVHFEVDSRLIRNPENGIVRYPGDPRIMATPDAYSDDGEVIAEFKTTSQPLGGGKYHPIIPNNYFLQVQAQLLCTGADRCVFTWETHSDFDEASTVIQHLLVEPDREVHEFLLAGAKRFLDVLDSEATFAVDDAEISDLLEEYDGLKLQMDSAKSRIDELKARLSVLLADRGSVEMGDFVVSVVAPTVRKTVNSRLLKSDFPEAYEACLRESEMAGSIRIKKVGSNG